MVYGIAFGVASRPLFLTHAPPAGQGCRGWRPVVWTRDRQRAEMFGSAESAGAFAREVVPHDAYRLAVIPPGSSPDGGSTGGTPVALAA